MLYKQPLIVVNNMKNSVEFYKEVLGLEIILYFGGGDYLTPPPSTAVLPAPP